MSNNSSKTATANNKRTRLDLNPVIFGISQKKCYRPVKFLPLTPITFLGKGIKNQLKV